MTINQPKILAIDDDREWLNQIPLILSERCEVYTAPTIDHGLLALEDQFFDIVLLDLNFDNDERTGMDVFRRIAATDRGADIIVISAETDREKLIEVMNAGVTRFLVKPVTPAKVREAVGATLDQREIRARAIQLAGNPGSGEGPVLVGSSIPMQRLRVDINRIVKGGIRDLLIQGESGTGKEVVAKIITSRSDSAKRFVPINCGAISSGLAESELFGHIKGAFTGAIKDRASAFEVIAGGFVFFDEIGEMPHEQQVKLLRVLQERKVVRVGASTEIAVNFRSISATNADLDRAIIDGRFREDLYYRIAKDRIRLPTLRERIEDIPELVEYFLATRPPAQRKTITGEALELLKAYHWPGNVRQLQSIVEVMESHAEGKVIREREVCLALPDVSRLATSRFTKALVGRYGASLIQNERDRFKKAIIEANGDRDVAAKNLGLSRATFFRKARDLGLVKERRARALPASH
jgi:DNA-binding NtrC family response regulator